MTESRMDVQISANSSLVLIAEPLVDILVHQRGLSDTRARVISPLKHDMDVDY